MRFASQTREGRLQLTPEQVHHKTWLINLLQSFVHLIKEPSYKFVRIVVLIIVEKLIGFFHRLDKFLVIENTLRFLLSVYAFK